MKIDLGYYFAVLLRRLHYIVILFAAGTALAVVVAYMLPPVYESTARLLLESAQIPNALAAPTVDTAALEQLQIFEQRLMTRQNLLEIARKFTAVPKMETLSPDDIVKAMRTATNIDKQAGIDQASMMIISFDAPSAQTAAAVVNEYVTRILSDSTSTRTSQAQDTLQFFRQEVERLSTDLSTQSAKILDFQKKNADALPETLNYRLSQQTTLQEHLASTERDIAALKDQKKRLIEIYRSTGQLDAARTTALSPEAQQMAQLKIALNQALAVYAPENPKVVLLQNQVAGLQARIDAQSKDNNKTAAAPGQTAAQTGAAQGTAQTGTGQTGAAQTGTAQTGADQTGTDQTGTATSGPATTGTAPTGTDATAPDATGTATTDATGTGTASVMSPLDIQTTQIDSQEAQLTQLKSDMTAQLAALTDSINRSAGVTVQLQSLQRDYNNIQEQYNTATDRLSKASTGERIEVLAKGQHIGVLDAASAPDSPSRPNRTKIILLGALAGLLGGFGLIVLTEMLNSSVRRPIDLERHLNITVIGSIPYVRTPGEALRRRLVLALVLVVVVVGLPAAVFLVDRYYLPLDVILAKINSKLGL